MYCGLGMFTKSDNVLYTVACMFKLTLHNGATKSDFCTSWIAISKTLCSKAEVLLFCYNGDRDDAYMKQPIASYKL